MNVYIWDMDETLILLKSLINGTYAEAFNGSKNVQSGVEIGKMWENHILQICDDHFFYEQVENCNMPYLDVLKQYDDGRDLTEYDFNKDGFGPPSDDLNKKRLAYRHRAVAHKYKKGLHSILDQDMIKSWSELYDVTDSYTDMWFSAGSLQINDDAFMCKVYVICLLKCSPSPSNAARACLEQCAVGDRDLASSTVSTNDAGDTIFQHVNILVTSGSLIPSLVKCLLFRLGDLIPSENVYSSWEVGKLQCFSWIKERFNGPNVQFCVIGDGWEECEAAESMRWPFVKIDPLPSSFHRFPGLTPKDLGHYFSVVYGNSDEKDNDILAPSGN
uniref:protein-tyrosine-phosphatase n=1 Tax=Solanum tuberosum TaxID=4113 RepID=M1BH93_SOLTU